FPLRRASSETVFFSPLGEAPSLARFARPLIGRANQSLPISLEAAQMSEGGFLNTTVQDHDARHVFRIVLLLADVAFHGFIHLQFLRYESGAAQCERRRDRSYFAAGWVCLSSAAIKLSAPKRLTRRSSVRWRGPREPLRPNSILRAFGLASTNRATWTGS